MNWDRAWPYFVGTGLVAISAFGAWAIIHEKKKSKKKKSKIPGWANVLLPGISFFG